MALLQVSVTKVAEWLVFAVIVAAKQLAILPLEPVYLPTNAGMVFAVESLSMATDPSQTCQRVLVQPTTLLVDFEDVLHSNLRNHICCFSFSVEE